MDDIGKILRIVKSKMKTKREIFWATHDSTEYIDWSKAIKNPKFSNLKLSTRSISVRLPELLLAFLKLLANKKDILCQSLLKIFLAERIKKELRYS